MWNKLIGCIICLIGIIMIYNARSIVRIYSSKNENKTTSYMKISGFLITIIGSGIYLYDQLIYIL